MASFRRRMAVRERPSPAFTRRLRDRRATPASWPSCAPSGPASKRSTESPSAQAAVIPSIYLNDDQPVDHDFSRLASNPQDPTVRKDGVIGNGAAGDVRESRSDGGVAWTQFIARKRNPGGHQPVVADVKELRTITRESRSRPALSRYLHLSTAARRDGPDEYLAASTFIRIVGKPTAVGRKIRPELIEARICEHTGLGRTREIEQPDVRICKSRVLDVSEPLRRRRPRAGELVVGALEDQLGTGRTIGSDREYVVGRRAAIRRIDHAFGIGCPHGGEIRGSGRGQLGPHAAGDVVAPQIRSGRSGSDKQNLFARQRCVGFPQTRTGR